MAHKDIHTCDRSKSFLRHENHGSLGSCNSSSLFAGEGTEHVGLLTFCRLQKAFLYPLVTLA